MRKINVLDTKYNNSGLHARIPALNNLTLLEFFEDNNILDFNDKAIYDGLVEAANESIAVGDKTITLYSTKKYFSGFDIVFETLPNTLPNTYRLWLVNQGVTDDISYSFVQGNNVMLGDIKSPNSNIGPNTLYLNLLNLNVGDTMKLKATHFNLIDITDYDLTDEDIYYYYRMYRCLKDNTQKEGYTYLPKGQSKYDVAYINKTIDEPIAELNGHTLREVFEHYYDFSDGLQGWEANGATLETERVHIQNTIGGPGYIVKNSEPTVNIGDTIFIVATLELIQNGISLGQSGNIGSSILTSGVASRKFTATATDILITRTTSSKETDGYADDVYIVNYSDYGISPETDMDYYYSLYQARKNITKKVLTYADIFEGFQEMENPFFENEVTDWLYQEPLGNYINLTVENNILVQEYVAGNALFWVGQSLEHYPDDDYYIATEAKASFNSYLQYSTEKSNLWNTDGITIDTLNTDFKKISAIAEFNEATGSIPDLSLGRLSSAMSVGDKHYFKYILAISIRHFDELITKEQLDTMLAHYLLVKNIVIYPEIYVPTEPIGLGNRFKLLSVDENIYGHELDFEDISFKMYFGVNYDAYKGYNDLMNMLKNNKAVIQYDWGIGPRLNDVRLIHAPKTEKNTSMLIVSKFIFKRLNPFYEMIEVVANEDMKNSSDLESPIKLDLTVNNTAVSIKLLDTSSGVQRWISFDFTGVSTPFNLTIDPESKKLLIDGMTDAYDYVDHTKDSFIYLPGDNEVYTLNITGAAVNQITYKKWVIS